MHTTIHRPEVQKADTLDSGTHVIDLADKAGGLLTLFIAADWADWDAIVSAVAAYRKYLDDKAA